MSVSNPSAVNPIWGYTGSNSTYALSAPPPSYLAGTRILTPTGERLVEDLEIGDVVVSRFGALRPIIWIGRRSYGKRNAAHDRETVPVCIQAGALGPHLPARDLYVSPAHSMLIDDTLILASALVNGINITQTRCPDRIDYYQIDLGTHDCIIAEGTWSESFGDGPTDQPNGLRGQFENFPDFHALYPNQSTPEALALCAPRPLIGAALERVLTPIVARAGTSLRVGYLEGCIDLIRDDGLIEGWALDHNHPELPVLLQIFEGDVQIGVTLACIARADLLEAEKGNGRCAFHFVSPKPLNPGQVRLVRASDQQPLELSDLCAAALAAHPGAELSLAA
jgi:hypothetical protein